MKKKLLCTIAGIALLGFVGSATAQQGMVWGTSSPAVDHLGATLAANSLVQLIVTTSTASGGTPPPPSMSDPFGNNAGESLAVFTTSLAGGNIANFIPNLGGAGLAEGSVVYARVFEQPSSGASGELPDPASGPNGIWYADATVVQIVPDLGATGQPSYNYQFTITQPDWNFVGSAVVPEPGSLAFMLLAVAGLATRRLRRS